MYSLILIGLPTALITIAILSRDARRAIVRYGVPFLGLMLLIGGALFGWYQFQEFRANATAAAVRTQHHAEWLKDHPKGCAEYAGRDDPVDILLETGGECPAGNSLAQSGH
jgi:hypothetical protein